ncbi:MAG: hypothetical protein KGL74_09310, partial [Elusimicrobia bacterium]|nr:hypothetical protein [Elusimicrobiota bacterium]
FSGTPVFSNDFGPRVPPRRGGSTRAGYTTQSAITGGSGFDAARGLTLGLGIRRDRWFLDYAVVPMGELGSTHRFGLGVQW